MVLFSMPLAAAQSALSVLALSSRFDGRISWPARCCYRGVFQYSLCRVVLMVAMCSYCPYSEKRLSVLALSSRFDGPSPRPAGH